MKFKLANTLALAALTTAGTMAAASAVEPTPAQPAATLKQAPLKTDWSIFQLGFFPGLPADMDHTNVAGFKIGAPFCLSNNLVYGVEASFLGSKSKEIDGVQISGTCALVEEANGLQVAPVTVADRCNGLQVGVVNVAKKGAFQIGIVNYIEDSVVPWMIGINFYF